MKIAINLMCLSGRIDEGQLRKMEQVKAIGFDGVEVPIFDGDETHYRSLGRKIADIGLERSCSTALPGGEYSAGLLSENSRIRSVAIDRLKQIIDSAFALGAQTVCGPMACAVGYFTGYPRTFAEWDRAVDAHKLLAQYASDAGMVLSFEPLNRFETYFVNTMEDGASFAAAVDHPSFRILYDTFHANIEEKNPVAAYDHVHDHIGNVHIAENDRGIPGRGHIDFAAIFKQLSASGYDGWLTIEAFDQSLPELAAATRIWRPLYKDFETLATQGYDFVSRSWSEAGR